MSARTCRTATADRSRAEAYNDIVALILKSNGFPAGSTELTPAAIAGVQIVSKDGPGELPANTLVRVVGCLTKSGNEWTLTSATAPVRTDKTQLDPADATVPLGTRTMALKFVLTKLDSFVGQRMSVSGDAHRRRWRKRPQRGRRKPRRRVLPINVRPEPCP